MFKELWEYSLEGDLEGVTRELRKKDIDANKTALHYACNNADRVRIVSVLLRDKRVDIKTPLWWSLVDVDNICNVKELLKRKNLDVNKGDLPICRACENGNKEAVILLLLHPEIKVNKTDKNGHNASHYAFGDVAYDKDYVFIKNYAQEVIKSNHYYWYLHEYYTSEQRRKGILEDGLYKYEGKWNHNDKFEGIGLLSIISEDLQSYIPQYYGEYKDGVKEGGGKEFSFDGKCIIYFGYFKNDKRDGVGIEFENDENGARRGVWKDGLFRNDVSRQCQSDLIKLAKRIESESDSHVFDLLRNSKHLVRNKVLQYGLFKYEGKWNGNDKFEGIGLLSIRSKDKSSYIPQYFGEFKDGQKEGGGKEYSSDGKSIIYFGYFKNNQRDGIGIEFDNDENKVRRGIWKDGSFVNGNINRFNYYYTKLIGLAKIIDRKNSHIFFLLKNSQRLESQLKRDKVLMYGLYKYEGEWNDNDKFEGIGKLSIRSKDLSGKFTTQYYGEYINGEKVGGKLYSSDGKFYFGYFLNDQRDGIGIEFDADENEIRRGIWKEGSFIVSKDDSQLSDYIYRLIELAKRIEKDSDDYNMFNLLKNVRSEDDCQWARDKALENGLYKYEGKWNEYDRFDGIGELSIRSKGLLKRFIPHYFGEFKDGKKEGSGKEFSSNGKHIVYYGKFKNDKRHGNGIEYENNGEEIRRGVWIDGVFIKIEEKIKEIPVYDVSNFKKYVWNSNRPRIFLQRSLLGRGSFCSVYIIDNQYAFKIFNQFDENFFPEKQKRMKKLFKDELRNLSNIRHPNICNFVGASWKPPVGIIMELCKQSVSDLLKSISKDENDSILLKEKLRIIYKTCVGMEYLHLNRITHSDFGLSKCIESFRMTRKDTTAGTAGYLAPEINNKKYTSAVDVFSFGVMMFELIFEKDIIECMNELIQKELGDDITIFASTIAYEMRRGKRPVIPKLTGDLESHEWIVKLIKQCWSGEPKKRPTFTNIIKIIFDNIKDKGYEDYVKNDVISLNDDDSRRANINVDVETVETPLSKKNNELTAENLLLKTENTILKKKNGEYVSVNQKQKKCIKERDDEISKLKRILNENNIDVS